MNFRQKLLLLLSETGAKQKELAALLGIDPSRMSRICTGKLEPTLVEALLISRKFGVSLEWMADDASDWGDRVMACNCYRS